MATFVGAGARTTTPAAACSGSTTRRYEPLALQAFAQIGARSRASAGRRRALAIHHRIGRLEIGEASVVIAAASPHRADAFAACRYAIERVKQIAPIWKHEHFDGGDVWIEGATADPDDEAARARRRWSARARDGSAVRAAARARRRAGAARDVPDGATVGDVWDALVARVPGAGATTSASISAAVNADYARITAPLSDGDEVAFLPPVSGG